MVSTSLILGSSTPPGPWNDANAIEIGSNTDKRASVIDETSSPRRAAMSTSARTNGVIGISIRWPAREPKASGETRRPRGVSMSDDPSGALGSAERRSTGRTSSPIESVGWKAASVIRLVRTREAKLIWPALSVWGHPVVHLYRFGQRNCLRMSMALAREARDIAGDGLQFIGVYLVFAEGGHP